MKKILLVDDEDQMLHLLKLYLEPYGFLCESVNGGNKAIEFIKEHNVQLVLMDVMMPDKSGWETVEEIRSFSKVPIIMLTARGDCEDMVRSINAGADGHITKPINEKRLLLHIEKMIESCHYI